MLTIGLTGGVGSGKGEVRRILQALGASVIDSDTIGHQVYRGDTPARHRLIGTFGNHIVGDDGEIDRRRLGNLVFSDPARRRQLEAAVWPAIRMELTEQIRQERDRGTAVLIIEAAVLYEAGWETLCDEVWAVTAPESVVLSRLQARNGMSEQAARVRVAAQMDSDERAARADVIICNDRDLAALKVQVERLWKNRNMERRFS